MIDVCLILEGTYPYLTGGVSGWVQTVVTGLPELTFAVMHLSAGQTNGRPKQPRYPLPSNLREVVEWPLVVEPDGTFVALSASLPQARVYHALSTGFAGMLGCQVKAASGRPLILTEHGIYWRELAAGADELECGFQVVPAGQDGVDLQPLRHHWRIKLQDMASQAYRQANAITTVCRANVQFQTMLGASPSRCRVIPNSVNWQALAPVQSRLPAADGVYRIGFVGRVVSIKDVFTFLRACRQIAQNLAKVEFYVIGPLDHDPAYVDRCRKLVAELDLTGQVTFTGETDPLPWYRRLDVVVLTSLSEGQPLVLLEAMAAGVPVVATEVGGCPELIQGSAVDDQALGPAGCLTPVGDPQATAAAVLNLCRDTVCWQRAAKAGQARVRRYYSTEQLCQAYRALYYRFV